MQQDKNVTIRLNFPDKNRTWSIKNTK